MPPPRPPSSAGGFPAIWYTLRKARQSGGLLRMYRALRSKNACKTCALGMGGQRGGMVNESGHFPEVCKKSVQAMAADLQGRIKPGFFDEFPFDALARFSPRELEAAGRLTEPLYAGPDDKAYRPISWDDALSRATSAMSALDPSARAAQSFFYFSGRSSNEAGFLLQLIARLYGTNNVNNCSYFCHQASGVGLKSVTGSGTATVTLDDIARCDLLFLIGGNPASNHPRLMRALVDLKRRGGKVIVINPLKEIGLVNFKVPSDLRSLLFGSPIADEYLQPHIGGDIALLAGIAKALHTLAGSNTLNRHFINTATDGYDAFRRSLDALDWPTIERESGIDRSTIERTARLYVPSARTIFAWTMGITHHAHGVHNVQMIANLALLRGMVGKPGAGLLPLRGHSNVQGIGSMGAVPQLPGPVLDAMQQRFGVTLPTEPGLDTLSCIERADQGSMRFALCLGGNLFGSAPDADSARRALSKIDTTVFLSTTLNTGHIHGRGRNTIILPVLARDEEPQPTTQESMFNFVRLSDGRGKSPARYENLRSEVQVIADLARRVLGDSTPLDFKSMEEHATIRQAIAAIIPGYSAIASIDQTKAEFHIDGRTFHHAKFPTPTGRATFHPVSLPVFSPGGAGFPPALDTATAPISSTSPRTTNGHLFRLMTIRSEGQFNTVVYEDEDIYRGQTRRDVILLNPADIARLGLNENDLVTVRSPIAQMDNLLLRAIDIRPGNAAMYYPEANLLVPPTADPASRTPSFKHIQITIHRSSQLPVLPS